MTSRLSSSLLILSLLACSVFAAKLATYNVDPTSIKVGGLSSGGFMAVQMHFAYSATIKGSAIVAGGPFWCAQGSQSTALTACMSSPASIVLSTLNNKAKELATSKKIDPVINIAGSNVYLFSGTQDTVVKQGVMAALKTQYENFGATVTSVFNIPAEHAFITNNFGNKCAFKGTPYINNCSFDVTIFSLTNMRGGKENIGKQQAVTTNDVGKVQKGGDKHYRNEAFYLD